LLIAVPAKKEFELARELMKSFYPDIITIENRPEVPFIKDLFWSIWESTDNLLTKNETKKRRFCVKAMYFGYLGIMRHPTESAGGVPSWAIFSVCPLKSPVP
jgi:hypothetical protein